jgi:TolB protein
MDRDDRLPRQPAALFARRQEGGINRSPVFSPDSGKIAFLSDRDAHPATGADSEIYVMNVDGSGVKRLTDAPGNDFPTDWR